MMWRTLLISGAVICAVAAGWYAGARQLALAADGFGVTQLHSSSVAQVSWNGTYLIVDSHMLGIERPDNVNALKFTVDADNRLVADVDGRGIVLGARDGAVENAGEQQPAFAVAPGDRAAFTRSRGRFSWPTWFDLNFMTGNSPSWKRFVYYRLEWKKSSGVMLMLNWRFEEWYYESEGRWMGADMVCEDSCGLVSADIRSAPR